MTYFTTLHWMFTVVSVVVFIIGFYFGIRLKGQMRTVALAVLILGMGAIYGVGMLSLDKNTKKAELVQFENKRVLRDESIIFSGAVVNTGNYMIGKVTLEIKLVNHASATSRLKGEDFYQTNAIFGNLFNFGGDTTVKQKSRPGSITESFVVATNLAPGERVTFSYRMPFPTYFSNIRMHTKLFNH